MKGIFILLYALVTIAMMFVLNVKAANEQYTPCHTGKGTIQLYNCGTNQDNLAQLQLRSTPIR